MVREFSRSGAFLVVLAVVFTLASSAVAEQRPLHRHGSKICYSTATLGCRCCCTVIRDVESAKRMPVCSLGREPQECDPWN